MLADHMRWVRGAWTTQRLWTHPLDSSTNGHTDCPNHSPHPRSHSTPISSNHCHLDYNLAHHPSMMRNPRTRTRAMSNPSVTIVHVRPAKPLTNRAQRCAACSTPQPTRHLTLPTQPQHLPPFAPWHMRTHKAANLLLIATQRYGLWIVTACPPIPRPCREARAY
jgi:hypothetical protein